MHWFFIIGFGLIIGSFLNVVIHRVPNKLSIVHPPSRCPGCESRIAPYDNIPVLSYLWLRGRCRHCGKSISVQYPAVEVASAVLASLVVWRFGAQPLVVPYVLLTFLLVAITVIDLQHLIIPNVITYPATLCFVLCAAAGDVWPQLGWPIGFLQSLAGVATGVAIIGTIYVLYLWLMGKEGMGLGDLKFLAMVGSLLGPQGVVMTLMLASFIGTLAAVPMMLAGRAGRGTEIPFGPFLALATYFVLLFGDEVFQRYMNLIRYGTF